MQIKKKSILIIESIHHSLISWINEHFMMHYVQKPISPNLLLKLIIPYDILIIRGRTILKEEIFFQKAKNLKLIIRAGSGLDNIDVSLAKKYRICVKNILNANANAVSEFVLGLMINLSRNMILANQAIYQNQWQRHQFYGEEIQRKNLAIIGLGSIGKSLALKAYSLGMNVSFYDPFILNSYKNIKKFYHLHEIFKIADFISLHLPNQQNTLHLINNKEFNMMKKTAFFINTSRGTIVNENALINAIKNNKIRGAALDVFSKEPFLEKEHLLKKYPEKIILTPHIAGLTQESEINMINHIKSLLMDYNIEK